MSYKAKNIGEFYCIGTAIYTTELISKEHRAMINVHSNMCITVDGDGDDVFLFESVDGTVRFVLAWHSVAQELVAMMSIYDSVSKEQKKLYQGFEQLSQPLPSLYLGCIFEKCFEIINDAKFTGTTSDIEESFTKHSVEEWSAARTKLFGQVGDGDE